MLYGTLLLMLPRYRPRKRSRGCPLLNTGAYDTEHAIIVSPLQQRVARVRLAERDPRLHGGHDFEGQLPEGV